MMDAYGLRGSIADVACGTGEFLASLDGRFSDLVGLDLSTRALEKARTICPRARYLQGNIEEQALAETFDVVVCMNALEEMSSDLAAIRHMAQMLKENGYLIIVTPHRKAYWTEKDALAGNKRRYERADLQNLLHQAGLRVRECRTWGWPLYRLWYRMMVGVDQRDVWKTSSRGTVARLASTVAYHLLRTDDLFTNTSRGSIMFAIAQR